MLGVYIKMGGREEGHPISHVLLPALVTQRIKYKLSYGGEKPALPPLTLLTQTQPFIFLPFSHSPTPPSEQEALGQEGLGEQLLNGKI